MRNSGNYKLNNYAEIFKNSHAPNINLSSLLEPNIPEGPEWKTINTKSMYWEKFYKLFTAQR